MWDWNLPTEENSYIVERMAAIVMKMVSLFVLCMLTASSQSQVTRECGSEELRIAAVDKVLASIGCDSYACGEFTS